MQRSLGRYSAGYLLTRSSTRYEKEFDSVQDVFELQVGDDWLKYPPLDHELMCAPTTYSAI